MPWTWSTRPPRPSAPAIRIGWTGWSVPWRGWHSTTSSGIIPATRRWNFAIYDAICDLVEDDDDAGFGQTWIDRLAAHADRELPGPAARWVRLAVGFTADEYQLSNQEREAIDRLRGDLQPDRDASLVTYLASRDQRPPADHLRDGIQALAWLREHA
jgi:hypothetical protein